MLNEHEAFDLILHTSTVLRSKLAIKTLTADRSHYIATYEEYAELYESVSCHPEGQVTRKIAELFSQRQIEEIFLIVAGKELWYIDRIDRLVVAHIDDVNRYMRLESTKLKDAKRSS